MTTTLILTASFVGALVGGLPAYGPRSIRDRRDAVLAVAVVVFVTLLTAVLAKVLFT